MNDADNNSIIVGSLASNLTLQRRKIIHQTRITAKLAWAVLLPHKQSIVIEKTPTLTSRYQFISGKQLCDKKVNPSWLGELHPKS